MYRPDTVRPLVLVMSEGCRIFARRKLRDARGAQQAARALLEHTLDVAETVGEVVLCAPADPETELIARSRGIALLPQSKGPLAARIVQAASAIAAGRSPVPPLLLLGDDCPGLSEGLVTDATEALASGAGSVWGRARDGGFWILGLSHWDPRLVASLATAVEWGTPRAGLSLARFLLGVPGRMVELSELPDLDAPEDLPLAIRGAEGVLARALALVKPGLIASEEESLPPPAAALPLSQLPRPPPAA